MTFYVVHQTSNAIEIRASERPFTPEGWEKPLTTIAHVRAYTRQVIDYSNWSARQRAEARATLAYLRKEDFMGDCTIEPNR